MHEAGHGLYEQGLPKAEHFGAAARPRRRAWASTRASRACGRTSSAARAPSGAGRSRRRAETLGAGARDAAERGARPSPPMNVVRPNLIRVDSDEATYNLHIMLRFDLERALLARRAARWPTCPAPGTTASAPTSAWRSPTTGAAACRTSTGRWAPSATSPPTRWATSTLPSSGPPCTADLPDLAARVEAGEFAPLLEWLRAHVHRCGPALQLSRAVRAGHRRAAPGRALHGLSGGQAAPALRPLSGPTRRLPLPGAPVSFRTCFHTDPSRATAPVNPTLVRYRSRTCPCCDAARCATSTTSATRCCLWPPTA